MPESLWESPYSISFYNLRIRLCANAPVLAGVLPNTFHTINTGCRKPEIRIWTCLLEHRMSWLLAMPKSIRNITYFFAKIYNYSIPGRIEASHTSGVLQNSECSTICHNLKISIISSNVCLHRLASLWTDICNLERLNILFWICLSVERQIADTFLSSHLKLILERTV